MITIGQLVCAGAITNCSFGMMPSTLNVLPMNQVNSTTPAATIMDHKPLVNIIPFGLCTSMSNPTVVAATTAALGVLTPQPCMPITSTPWLPGSTTVTIGKLPALNSTSSCTCQWGGIIKIANPGQLTVNIP
ncbi:DUF4280 domain-containing protein [Paenibacillus yanchengensis]|uniref:DUF4280 domain-containing protein n=1 Tax=Paenibacillus yanchengensis TaxID=2035833 RepID=A0ABW4YEQ5_9BACL